MSTITLLTDFGVHDEYVGVMKGVILGVNPSARIVDITHHIDPQDILQAAYLIPSYCPYFSKGTVHIIVVDPGVGSDRAIIALEMTGQFFLAPDNGVLSLQLDSGTADSLVRIDKANFFLEPVSRTFHGRDIFAPVGAHISAGVDIQKMGTSIDIGQLVRLDIQKPRFNKRGELIGTIISIDRFGNLITNIRLNDVNQILRSQPETKLIIEIGKSRVQGISESYQGAESRNPLAIIGSRGYLEIAVNRDSAQDRLKLEKGDMVKLTSRQ
jgi:S-adenosylmethionine hydrolase